MIWLASLATLPLPISPTRVTEDPMTARISFTCSNAVSGPPTMTASVPSIALGSPPLAGASSMAMPRAAKAAAISRLPSGAIELMSSNTAPGRTPSLMPSVPRAASRTSG